ncbi:hypothetical protein ABZY11_42940, partial [Streptomyces sp. NPDC006510]
LGDADDMGAPAMARRASVQERVVAYNKVLREGPRPAERWRWPANRARPAIEDGRSRTSDREPVTENQ